MYNIGNIAEPVVSSGARRYHGGMANITISVVHNIQDAVDKLGAYDSTQLRFAAAKSLTNVAQAVKARVVAEMPNRFTLRRTWVQKGIRVQPATKANLTAVVGSIDPFMERQEIGAFKVPMGPRGKYIAVPNDNVLPGSTARVANADLPKKLGDRGFRIKAKDGRMYLAKRFLKGARKGVQILYSLKLKTDVKKRLGLVEIGEQVIAKQFRKIFTDNLLAAQRRPKKIP